MNSSAASIVPSRSRAAITLAACVTMAIAPRAHAESAALRAPQVAVNRLNQELTSAVATFTVDSGATSLLFEVVSSSPGVGAAIQLPNSAIITPLNIGSFGGESVEYTTGPNLPAQLLGPIARTGTQRLFRLPSQGPGTYRVNLSNPPGSIVDIAVVTNLLSDSPLGVTLFPTEPVIIVGARSVLAAAMFDGSSRIAGAGVQVHVQPPQSAEFPLILLDDGGLADAQADDGLYSGSFIATEEGEYVAVAEINGVAAGGSPFSRTAATRVRAVLPCATLAGNVSSVFQPAAGPFDRLEIRVTTDSVYYDEYVLHVTLVTPSGRTLVASAHDQFSGGQELLSIGLDAAAICAANEDGPYTVTGVDLLCVGSNGAQPAGRLSGNLHTTSAFTVDQFACPVPDRPAPEWNPIARNRFLTFTPPLGATTGLEVTVVALDANSVANPATYANHKYWAGEPQLNINDGISPAFNAAKVQCDFHPRDWTDVASLNVYGSVIVPGSTYTVRSCMRIDGPCSAPLEIKTAKFGDIVNPLNTVNFQDVNSIVAKFQGIASGPSKTQTKLNGSVVNPVNPVNFQEVSACVAAFQGKSFKAVVMAAPATCP